MGSIQLAVKLQ